MRMLANVFKILRKYLCSCFVYFVIILLFVFILITLEMHLGFMNIVLKKICGKWYETSARVNFSCISWIETFRKHQRDFVNFLQFVIRPLISKPLKGVHSNSKYTTLNFASNKLLIKFTGHFRVGLSFF